MRRATYHYALGGNPETISIHALHEESDRPLLNLLRFRFDFNPRSP